MSARKSSNVLEDLILWVLKENTNHSLKFIVRPWESGTLLRRNVAYPSLNTNRQRLEQFLAVALSVGIPQCLRAERDTSLLWRHPEVAAGRDATQAGCRWERDPKNILTLVKTALFLERDQAVFCQEDLKQSHVFFPYYWQSVSNDTSVDLGSISAGRFSPDVASDIVMSVVLSVDLGA